MGTRRNQKNRATKQMVMEASDNHPSDQPNDQNSTTPPKKDANKVPKIEPPAPSGAQDAEQVSSTPRTADTNQWTGWLATQSASWLDIRPSTPTISELLSDDDQEEPEVVENQELAAEILRT